MSTVKTPSPQTEVTNYKSKAYGCNLQKIAYYYIELLRDRYTKQVWTNFAELEHKQ
jgi:hypothetical protein